MEHRAALGLGSNLGDRRGHLRRALALLGEAPGVRVAAVSRFLETEPEGGPPGQRRYLNACCVIRTALPPRELLALALEIERRCGRIRGAKWGPRTLDVDILFYDQLVLEEPGLVIPHPRLAGRAFVLEPLAEVAPDWLHPALGLTVRQLRERLRGGEAG